MKQYEDSVLPLIKGSVVEQAVSKKWSTSLRSLEQKINMGLERQLNAIVGYVRFVLSSEQKKADFRPDSQQINLGASAVCFLVDSCIFEFEFEFYFIQPGHSGMLHDFSFFLFLFLSF
ncbi:unnamed protein product [Nippostrongylus brasiliensis]|uniref:Exocyst complex component 5 (inferred by orthology to a C. elegans protein) n=1 Tax=Nippostrongylus brasiliensis TaxID=27835 RepID=A0A0N4XNV3_NIPBR|nr:unnamed protein product [Nippostrongylus brasiliensis]